MVDVLMAWVVEADNEIATAEATPISDDLEALEKQLAEHEVKMSCALLYYCSPLTL